MGRDRGLVGRDRGLVGRDRGLVGRYQNGAVVRDGMGAVGPRGRRCGAVQCVVHITAVRRSLGLRVVCGLVEE